MKKQTAVEWLIDELTSSLGATIYLQIRNHVIIAAKEMEKKQIQSAYLDGCSNEYEYHENQEIWTTPEQYYANNYSAIENE